MITETVYDMDGNVCEPMTNDDWRRTCSKEEFAMFLAGITDDSIMLAWKIKNHCCDDEKEAAMRWLAEKHKE